MLGVPLPVREADFPVKGVLLASVRGTVMGEGVDPSATSDVGLALTLEVLALTVPAVKATVAVWVSVTESVTSLAVYVTDSALVSFTVKVTTPLALEAPLAAEMVEVPVPCDKVTVFP